ncbi:hypothetical protein [Azospirillum sp. SYSU D00513]|uniref:hypothetical protein n=1 Tax=Azospirillum sp. SYSU D00513 TaxID=2812561 RepID=UPI001A956F69|nr:hypothetical protein [Azospirillum sp. SYSU D00513]
MMKPARTPESAVAHEHEEAVAALFEGTRSEAVAEGRADVDAGRVYDADAVKRWKESWDTPEESERPDAK